MAGVTLPLDQEPGNGCEEETSVSGGALLAPARRGPAMKRGVFRDAARPAHTAREGPESAGPSLALSSRRFYAGPGGRSFA